MTFVVSLHLAQQLIPFYGCVIACVSPSHSSMTRHWGIPALAIVTAPGEAFPFGIYLAVELLDHVVILCLILGGTASISTATIAFHILSSRQ